MQNTLASLAYLKHNRKAANSAASAKEHAAMTKKLLSRFKPVSWAEEDPGSGCLKIVESQVTSRPSATLISNTTAIVEPVESVLANAKRKLAAGAYLHWYEQHGVDQDKFLQAFYTLEEMLDFYQ